MKFTKQDLLTFALGAIAACGVTIGEALTKLDTAQVDDLDTWAVALGSGLLSALLRYAVTRVPQLFEG